MKPILHSPRLELRPCTEADIDRLLTHWTHPDVRRYLFDDRIIDRADVEGYIVKNSQLFQNNSYGLWNSIDKASGAFQGVGGLWHTISEEPDLFYSIEPPFWGQGLATESAICVLEYAFEVLKLPKITVTVDKPNLASIRVIHKLEIPFLEERTIEGNPTLIYVLNRDEYNNALHK